MELIALGTGTALPTPDHGPSGFVLKEGRTSVLVDCGSGMAQKLVKVGTGIEDLDAILISHAHLDHMADLPALLFSLNVSDVRRSKPLDVIFSEKLRSVIKDLHGALGKWIEPTLTDVHYKPVRPGDQLTVGELSIDVFAVDHHRTSVGYKLTTKSGASVALPSDTQYCASMVKGVQGVDGLVIECSFTDETSKPGHMTPSQIIRLIKEAKPKLTMITHRFHAAQQADVLAQIGPHVSSEVLLLTDGNRLSIGSDVSSHQTTEDTEMARLLDQGAGDDPSPGEMRALIEADLNGIDPKTLSERKFSSKGSPPKRKEPRIVGQQLSRRRSQWKAESLSAIKLSRQQQKFLRQADRQHMLPELNLRRYTQQEALKRAVNACKSWRKAGVVVARIITGKGKRSQQFPVVKLAVLNWLDGPEGLALVRLWAPEVTSDGNFGSLILELRGT